MGDQDLRLASHVDRGPSEYRFRVREGTSLVGTDSFRPSELALLSSVDPASTADVLAVDGNYGVPGIVLAALTPDGEAVVTETSARCASLIRSNAEANGVTLSVALVPAVEAVEGRFDLAVLAPRQYDPVSVVTQRALDALETLRPGGTLVIAGRAETGAGRIAETLGDDLTVERSRTDGIPVYRVERPKTFSAPALVSDRRITATVCDLDRTFVTQPGLFSPNALDDGTRLLLEALVAQGYPRDGDTVLDLCCGYGAVGATLGGLADVSLVLTDVDRRATACAERTLAANGLTGDVFTGDGLDAVDGPFDLVVTNPPTHAGQTVTDDLFADAATETGGSGTLAVVYNETLGYARRLERWFDTVEVVLKEAGYVVALAGHLRPKDTA